MSQYCLDMLKDSNYYILQYFQYGPITFYHKANKGSFISLAYNTTLHWKSKMIIFCGMWYSMSVTIDWRRTLFWSCPTWCQTTSDNRNCIWWTVGSCESCQVTWTWDNTTKSKTLLENLGWKRVHVTVDYWSDSLTKACGTQTNPASLWMSSIHYCTLCLNMLRLSSLILLKLLLKTWLVQKLTSE